MYNKQNEELEIMYVRRISSFEDVILYLDVKYKVVFPEDIRKDLKKKMKAAGILLNKSTLDALMAEWEIWKPYVSENPAERENFIVDGIKSLIKIKVTGTSNDEELVAYIGNKCNVEKALPVEPIYTTVTLDGSLLKNGLRIKAKPKPRKTYKEYLE